MIRRAWSRGLRPGPARREVLALLGLGAAIYTFQGPAQRLSQSMLDARARSAINVQLHHLVAACVQLDREGSGLPAGEDAARAAELLSQMLSADAARSSWTRQALAALRDDQIAAVRAGARRDRMPGSRAHPYIPPEMLLASELLAARFGSVPAAEPLEPDESRWREGQPLEIQLGLLTLLQEGSPPLDELQARQISAALLTGMQAHQRLPPLIAEFQEITGPDLAALSDLLSQSPSGDRDLSQAALAIQILRRRAGE